MRSYNADLGYVLYVFYFYNFFKLFSLQLRRVRKTDGVVAKYFWNPFKRQFWSKKYLSRATRKKELRGFYVNIIIIIVFFFLHRRI